MAIAFGAAWALGVLAVGSAGIVAFHLWHLGGLANWAAGPVDDPVPEGRGSWRAAFSALYRRVRARNLAQRDLVTAMERFRSVAEAIPDGMVVLDASNRVEWANTRARAHLGLDLAHDLGRPLVNLVRQPEFIRYLEAGDYSDVLTVASQREPGATLSIQLIPFGLEEKLLISRDVTQLEAVARMRRDFIANVSHEMKTPLTVVAGFIETLQDMELEPRQRARYLQLMHEQARNMKRLVDDLLTLSALESDQNALAEAPFAVEPLLLSLSADAKALSGGRHTIALDIHDAATVLGSRDELASAFGNLVSNAIRYTPEGGTVTLVVADRRGRARRVRRRGHRDRDRRRAHSAAHRTFLSRGPQPFARDRRHRTRPRDRQARAAATRCGTRRDERARPRQHVHRTPAGAARDERRAGGRRVRRHEDGYQ